MKCEECGNRCIGGEFREMDDDGNVTKMLCRDCFYDKLTGEELKCQNIENKYEQLKTAVQDLLIDLKISRSNIQYTAAQPHFGMKMSSKTAQKLIDAGVLE